MGILRNLREIMELTVAQVADELNVPRQDVLDAEETGSSYLLPAFIAAFPINPQILSDEDADPFLDSFDQTSPGERMNHWRKEHHLSAAAVSQALGIPEEELEAFEKGEGRPLNRRQGERIEKLTGINRKWLMYGDGRERGTPVLCEETAEGEADRSPRRAAPNREAGEKIRSARLEAGLSREALSELQRMPKERQTKKDQDTIRDGRIAREMYARGISFVPIDIYKAKARECIIIDETHIMPPISSVEGLGDKACEQVEEAARSGPFTSLDSFRELARVNKTSVDKMVELGILEGLPESDQLTFDFFLSDQ